MLASLVCVQGSVLYLSKQAVGLLHGLACGVTPVTGPTAIFSYFFLTIAATWAVSSRLQRGEELGLEGQFEVVKEGVTEGAAVFFLTWIVSYTLVHA